MTLASLLSIAYTDSDCICDDFDMLVEELELRAFVETQRIIVLVYVASIPF